MIQVAKKNNLVKTAVTLFSKYGFHAVGIDMLAKEANISKRTLYSYFDSKEDLIIAALEAYGDGFFNEFVNAVNTPDSTPQQRLLSMFDVAEAWFSRDDFYGCIFVSATNEYPAPQSEIRDRCTDFKLRMLDEITRMAKDAGVKAPATLASHLSILLSGAVSLAQINGQISIAQDAKSAARVLIENAL